MTPSSPPSSRARTLAYLLATALTVGLWTITLYQLHLARDMHMQMTQRNLVSVTRSLHAHATRTIQLADQAAIYIKREFQRQAMALDLNQMVQDKALTEDIFTLFTVVDANADVALSTRSFERVNLSDREHIKVHLDQDSEQLYIGKPVVGRVSGKASIQFTRRINTDEGTFGGVVVVSMDPYYFTDVYGSLSLNEQSVISLTRTDGLILVRRTGSDQAIGVDVSDSVVFQTMMKNGLSEGIFEASSEIDKVNRIWSYQMLDRMPLVVAVGVDLGEELAPFHEMQSQIYVLATLLSLVIYGFAFVVGRFVDKIHESRQEAVQANSAKSEFLSNVSHELRTPINGILGYAELLEIQETNPEKAGFLRNIQQSGSHLLSLVNSILALNRIEKGQMDLALKDEDLRRLLQEAIDSHQQSARAKGLSLTLEVAPDVPQKYTCDRVKLLQILHNLIHNAIKFTPKGSVTVLAGTGPGELIIQVRDTGRGISEEHQSTVFDRFFQSSSSGHEQTEGFGLGLAIVRQLVQLMQGQISMVSRPGIGTTFTVNLPLRPVAHD
ncbi:sensor histidine kinase [Orrella marina]|uniref:Virulence sensor protein BvgS n=1 Tax=Orrella marina TaxID=2163011 RepID=A0A2R4XGH6_9BURK|nr:ATP-binding protein [Orrella marina]AWB32819.1 two-component sensor histidine kinase [Orrella marina]